MATGRKSHFRSEDLDKPVFQPLDWHPHRSASVVRDDKPITFNTGADFWGFEDFTFNTGADFWGFEDFHAAIVSGLTDLVQLVLPIG